MALETELATYERLRPELLADPEKVGKYVLIKGEELLGLFTTRSGALTRGYEQSLYEPFMVKQLLEVEPVYYLSRTLTGPI